jgi:hypothetical protein
MMAGTLTSRALSSCPGRGARKMSEKIIILGIAAIPEAAAMIR